MTAVADDTILVIDGIRATYNHAIAALNGVSLTVRRGEIRALLGANGAGKTTTLKAVSNLLYAERGQVTEGQVVFEARDVAKHKPSDLVAAGLAQVLEGRHCFRSITVEENLVTGALGRRSTRREISDDLDRVYTYFPRLKEKRRALAGLTSGGEQQMTAIGRALMSRPRLLVLDEPSMGLAPKIVASIFETLRRLNRESGLSILLAEQNAAVALRYADRATILETGRTVLEGSALELRARSDIKAFYLGEATLAARAGRALANGQSASRPSRSLEPPKENSPMTLATHSADPAPAYTPTHANGSTQPKSVSAVPRPKEPAHVIRDDAEAIAVAEQLAAQFADGASDRDRFRRWPIAELDAFSQSGLWSINVPKKFGGPEVSYATLARVIDIIAAADPSLAQVPQNHLGIIAAIRTVSDDAQQKLLFAEALCGTRFGNAFSERGSKRAADFDTKFTDAGDDVIVNGQKFYCTGAVLAHVVPIVAADDRGRAWYAFADRDAPGLSVIDDWSSFGQRTTLSGTVLIDNVRVPKTHLVPAYKGYDRPTADGAIFQIIHAAVDTGIARAAIEDAIAFVRTKARAWVDSGQDHAWEDPYTIQAVGDLTLRLHAAQALLEKAGLAIDRAVTLVSAETVAAAQIAVAEAKVLSTEIAIAATNKLFELAGARSTLNEHNFDRHWRNARTHTLHDPVRWKYAILGNYALNGINPPLHAWS